MKYQKRKIKTIKVKKLIIIEIKFRLNFKQEWNNIIIKNIVESIMNLSYLSMHFTFQTFRIIFHTIIDRFLDYVCRLNRKTSCTIQ